MSAKSRAAPRSLSEYRRKPEASMLPLSRSQTATCCSKEYLVAVRERDDLLSMTTMLFADEIRGPREIETVPSGSTGRPRRGEVAQAEKVIEAMTRDFDPSRYKDCHRSRLMKIIQRSGRPARSTCWTLRPSSIRSLT